MVIADQPSQVPTIDAEALERLARTLDRDGVVAAMLIGSQAPRERRAALGCGHRRLARARPRAVCAFEAAAGARRLIERDAKARVRLEARAILDYLDTKPLRAELARGQRNRLEEGRFGRR